MNEVKDFYYAIVRTITKGLREGGAVELPDLGKFRVVEHAARNFKPVNSEEIKTLPPTKTIKFSADYKLKKYFKELC